LLLIPPSVCSIYNQNLSSTNDCASCGLFLTSTNGSVLISAIIRKCRGDFTYGGKEWERSEPVCKIQPIENNTTFRAIFDRVSSIDFWNHVRLGLFDHRAPSYYSLSGQAQMIIRAIGWSLIPSKVRLATLVKICGIKHDNKTIQIEQIEKYLEEAKGSWIRNFKAGLPSTTGQGGTKSKTYNIIKVKKWPIH